MSTVARNSDIIAALEGRGHEILNVGMRHADDHHGREVDDVCRCIGEYDRSGGSTPAGSTCTVLRAHLRPSRLDIRGDRLSLRRF